MLMKGWTDRPAVLFIPSPIFFIFFFLEAAPRAKERRSQEFDNFFFFIEITVG